MQPPSQPEFKEFLQEVQSSLRRALFETLGLDSGREATSQALAWAWEHWPRVKRMRHPGGFPSSRTKPNT